MHRGFHTWTKPWPAASSGGCRIRVVLEAGEFGQYRYLSLESSTRAVGIVAFLQEKTPEGCVHTATGGLAARAVPGRCDLYF